jgi:hypothetical protein
MTLQNTITEVIHQRALLADEAVDVVLPNMMDTYSPKDRQVIITPETTTRAAEHDCMGNPPASGWKITYQIRVLVRQDENGPHTSVDEDLSTLTAGVYNAICGEADWWTMNGNALNAEWTSLEREITELQMAAYQMSLDVYYRTDETNLLNRR